MLLSPGEKIPPSINPTSTPENTQQPVVKCPRCDSPNTKFCYYNNYSLSQPRHFCKTCRRYWTKGGALRNVPVGGGCRKNKKLKTGSFISPSSRISATSCLIDDHLMNTRHDNNKDNDNDNNNNQMGTSEFGFSGLRFLHSVVSPAIDFQLGTSSFSRATTTTQNSLFHQFSSFPELSQTNNSGVISAGGIDLASGSSFQYPSSTTAKQHGDGNFNGNYNISLVSSIESLSSMNQELHWKLQQQRIAMLYDISTKKQNTDSTNGVAVAAAMVERPLQPIMFQSLEMTTTNEGSSSLRKDAPTEWFFDGSFAPGPVATTPTNSGGNGSNENGDGGDGGGSGGGRGGFGGVQLWSDLPQFTGLPLN